MISKIGDKEHKLKEIKVLKSKLKPLIPEYTSSLAKLKEKLVTQNKSNLNTKKNEINENN